MSYCPPGSYLVLLFLSRTHSSLLSCLSPPVLFFLLLKNNLSSTSLRTHITYQGLICVLLLTQGNIIVAFNLSICLIRAGMSVFFSYKHLLGSICCASVVDLLSLCFGMSEPWRHHTLQHRAECQISGSKHNWQRRQMNIK